MENFNSNQANNELFNNTNNCVLIEFCKQLSKESIKAIASKYTSVITGKTVLIYDISLKDLFLLSFNKNYAKTIKVQTINKQDFKTIKDSFCIERMNNWNILNLTGTLFGIYSEHGKNLLAIIENYQSYNVRFPVTKFKTLFHYLENIVPSEKLSMYYYDCKIFQEYELFESVSLPMNEMVM